MRTTADRLDRIAAEEELREAEARRQAVEEMRAAAAHRAAPAGATAAQARPSISPYVRRLAADYQRLGVSAGADLDAVEAAWRALATRADPKRFPAGSEEEKKAAEILSALNESYARIREALNPTEGRFGQLEL